MFPDSVSDRLIQVIPATNTAKAAATSQATGPPRAGAWAIPSSRLSPRQAPMISGPRTVRLAPRS